MKSKKKTTIDFETEVIQLVKDLANENETSLSTVVNIVLYNLLGISRKTREELIKIIYQLRQDLLGAAMGSDLIYSENYQKDIFHLSNIIKILNKGKADVEMEPKMKRVDCGNGYCIVPEDWLVVNRWIDSPKVYPGAIEVKNASRYEDTLGKIPHVLFFQQQPINFISKEEEDYIIDEVIKLCPAYENIQSMQIKPIYNDNHEMLNWDIYAIAPVIGFFELPEAGDEVSTFPYGAQWIKTQMY